MQIIWTEQAKLDYWENIAYLEKEWSLSDVYNFMDKVDDLIILLNKRNLTFKPTKYKTVFQVPITKQITLFYKVNEDRIFLVRFWNNYKDPNTLSLK